MTHESHSHDHTHEVSFGKGVQDVGQEAGLVQELAAAPGLRLALVGQVDVDPAGEQVLRVPLALPVTEQHQRRSHVTSVSPRDVGPWGARGHGVSVSP